MKILSVNNNIYRNNVSNNQQDTSKKQSVAFTGISDTLVKFWQMIDNGGRAAQFTIEDMCGTNGPRTYKGALAGYKYTGKINIPALLQEATREFLTGPTMCITPLVVLMAASKMNGKTVNTHLENITNLSNLMSKLEEGKIAKETYKNNFYKAVTEDFIEQTIGKKPEEVGQVDSIVKSIINYEQQLKTVEKAKGRLAKKAAKKNVSEAFDNLQSLFERTVKSNKDSYSGTNFLNVKYTVSGAKTGETSFKNYMNYTIAYAKDYAKRNSKGKLVEISNELVNRFKTNYTGKRVLTFTSMFALTGILMSKIPKLYTLVSGKINPNAKTIYNEADKKGGR